MSQVREKVSTVVARAAPLTIKVAERLPFAALEGVMQEKSFSSPQWSCPSARTTEMLEMASAVQVTLSFSVPPEEGSTGKRMESFE